MKLNFFISLFLLSLPCLAFIPPSWMIINRTSDNAGTGYYQIEQEIEFPGPTESFIIKETWLIENENSMKMLASTMKDGKEYALFSCQYSSLQKSCSGASKKLPDDFFERFFHYRSGQNLINTMVQLKLVPERAKEKQKIFNIKSYSYRSEDFIRLSRVGGVVNYAFGEPSPEGDAKELPAGMWIEQDQFLIRKIRLPSYVEIYADKYSNYSKGLAFPKERHIEWDNKQLNMKTLSVVPAGKDKFSGFAAKIALATDWFKAHPSWPLVDEFYARFR